MDLIEQKFGSQIGTDPLSVLSKHVNLSGYLQGQY